MGRPATDNAVYDRLAGSWWEEEGLLHLLETMVNPWRVEYFRRRLSEMGIDPPGKRMLDVGCGGGLLAERFAAMGFAVAGIDPSSRSVSAARNHASTRKLPIDYGVADGRRLPFPGASFDMVSCCDVLEHVADWEMVVAEAARVLRRDGVLFFETVNRTLRSRLSLIWALQEWPPTRIFPPDFHLWEMLITPEELRRALARNGLQLLRTVGGRPGPNLLQGYLLLRHFRKGRIGLSELGRSLQLRECDDLSLSYAGCAVKP